MADGSKTLNETEGDGRNVGTGSTRGVKLDADTVQLYKVGASIPACDCDVNQANSDKSIRVYKVLKYSSSESRNAHKRIAVCPILA